MEDYLSEFRNPHELGMVVRQIRDNKFERSADRKQVCVGWHNSQVRICDDNGAIDYMMQPDGRFFRTAHPGYCTQIEWVDRTVQELVTSHNQRILALATA